ncbi:hypothetical protein NUW54_g3171 [Trametes sanguinea]|uniref:Uncharacterized protein n=1 Tax=Trametes sanguinea TaxID=158606 RepID=A0ACC1Q224_9APHY|nr:hypothetical protein NUW54_g3171 [Trametes sanguinea]
MCNMIRSGELMKYALAIADKLLRVYGPAVRIKLGYNIGWVISCIVPAFHGHSHNRVCQLDWHPMYSEGCGKEDFEGCERFFSASNNLASGTRLSTAFHCHQAIEGHVGFWADRKHIKSGKFIYNNYRQALEIISQGTRALDVYAQDLQTTAADYESYLFEYIEALQALGQEGIRDRAACEQYKKLDYLIIAKGIKGQEITAIKREYLASHRRVQDAEQHVQQLEEELDLDERWLLGSSQYQKMASELHIRKYRRALDNLERSLSSDYLS